MAIAAVVIIGAVILITNAKSRKSEPIEQTTEVTSLADTEVA
jgi:hypothetical protein